MSLIVVASALPFRAGTVPFGVVAAHWPVIVNLLAGSLLGAWFGAGWATRLRSQTLYRVIAVMLVLIAFVLLFAHDTAGSEAIPTGTAQAVAGVVAGFCIGIVASLLGVAGGELLLPTLVLLFGADIKLAGSLSLAVSLPTMIVGFTRYSRDRSFAVLGQNRRFVLVMAVGSGVEHGHEGAERVRQAGAEVAGGRDHAGRAVDQVEIVLRVPDRNRCECATSRLGRASLQCAGFGIAYSYWRTTVSAAC